MRHPDLPPAGRIHPLDRCAFCGARGNTAPLRLGYVRETLARAAICIDQIACVRRQMRRKIRSAA